MSTRHSGVLLCKNCGTLCILPLKSAKTYQNRGKTTQIKRRSTVFNVFRPYFYAFTLRYAALSCFSVHITFHFSLLSKDVGKIAPDGIRILLVTLCPNKKLCSRYRMRIWTQKTLDIIATICDIGCIGRKSPYLVQIHYPEWDVRCFRNKLREYLELFDGMCYNVHCNIVSIIAIAWQEA